MLERHLGSHDSFDRASRRLRFVLDQTLAGYNHRHGKVEAHVRAVSTPDVEHDGTYPATYCKLGSHAVRPETIDLTILESLRRHNAKIHAAPMRPRNCDDVNSIPLHIDPRLVQQPTQTHCDERSGADIPSFDNFQATAFWA